VLLNDDDNPKSAFICFSLLITAFYPISNRKGLIEKHLLLKIDVCYYVFFFFQSITMELEIKPCNFTKLRASESRKAETQQNNRKTWKTLLKRHENICDKRTVAKRKRTSRSSDHERLFELKQSVHLFIVSKSLSFQLPTS
jgi:hypothetical protein